MKWLAIVNPSCGGGKSYSRISRILRHLEKLNPATVTTKYPGHAEQLAGAASDYDGLAVVGGDGTVLEALNGMDRARQRLALIPAGTGNSLARDLGLNSVAAAIDAIFQEWLVQIDLMSVKFQNGDGSIRQRLSDSTLALGYPAAAAKTTNQRLKGLGKFCYPAAAAVETLFQKRFRVRLAYNGGVPESKSLTGLILNNTRHVGNFLAFPRASLQDDAFDVMELNADFWRQNFHNLSVLSKRYFYLSSLPKSAKSLCLNLETPQDLVIDGEIYPAVTHAEVQIFPTKLTCYQKEEAVQ